MRKMILIAGMGVGLALGAAPTVTDVSLAQNARRMVTVTYTLGGEDAIVTADFLVDGASLGERRFTSLAGDVNRRVAPGTHSFTWDARADWPDQQRTAVTVKVKAWTTANPPDYMVVDLDGTTKGDIRYFVSTNALPAGGLANDCYRKTKLVLRKIPARNKVWAMGGDLHDSNRFANERLHLVVLSKDYFFTIYPVTQQQYMNMKETTSNPSHFLSAMYGSDDHLMGPVESVAFNTYRGGSWPVNDEPPAENSMIGKLRTSTGMTGFDLPTEAQWEFACRAGTTTFRPWGNAIDVTNLNYNGNVKNENPADTSFKYRTTRVDAYPPNPWGLYDMLGNVEEMCLDRFSSSLPEEFTRGEPVRDPVGPRTGDSVVTRGGGCLHGGEKNRSAWRRDSGTALDQKRGVVGTRICCPVE